MLLVPLSGLGAATTTETPAYVAVQGENCTPITAFSDDKSPREFYDYRIPDEENPYINRTGSTYSSGGTQDLQRPNTSIAFLYTNERTDRLSLVFVHGNLDNESSVGGAATFDITGLPEDGRWTVKDDEYNGSTNYDTWSADSGDTLVNWTWGDAATDGGVYTGLGDDSTVTVEPAFNEDAELYEEFYEGNVTQWEVLSNEDGDVERTELALDETLHIVSGTCEDVLGGDDADDETDTDEYEDTEQKSEQSVSVSQTSKQEATGDDTEQKSEQSVSVSQTSKQVTDGEKDAGPPEHAGPPEDTGAPEHAGPPENAGPPEDAGPPDDIEDEGDEEEEEYEEDSEEDEEDEGEDDDDEDDEITVIVDGH